MSNITTNDLFRLSAILYADNNYEVSSQTIHKKIIESALYTNDNKYISILDLCQEIEGLYKLVFTEDDILNVINSPKNDGFEQANVNGDNVVRLTSRRLDSIASKIQDKTIDDYISEFEQIFQIKAQSVIHRYLYDLFTNDVQSFQRLV